MRKMILAIAAVAVTSTATVAADDPVAARKALMQALGAAAGLSGGMMKGDIDYNPVAAKAAIATANGVAHSFGDYFSEGSIEGETTASPKIWEDSAGFEEQLGKFKTAASSAMQASGKDGPADVEAFKAAMGPVLGTCKDCHEGYRVKK